MDHFGDFGRAIYRAANESGTSLLEMSNRIGYSASALERGSSIDIRLVAKDTEVPVQTIWEWIRNP